MLERWMPTDLEEVLSSVEDKYSFLLLRSDIYVHLPPFYLSNAAQENKRGSHGMDGWSYRELKALFLEAWYDFKACSREHPTFYI